MPLVIPESTTVHSSAKPRLLMCETTGVLDALLGTIGSHGYGVAVAKVSRTVSVPMRTFLSGVDIVLLDVTLSGGDVLDTIEALNTSVGICSVRPRLLCFSTAHRNPNFVMALEKCGARYVRVSSPLILLEAIDQLLFEMNELERNGPSFKIVHRYSQGSCAPGEEVFAVLLADYGEFRQLPLAVAERLIFDFLAKHKRIGLDSLQIVSGLTGDWFYKEHALNSGHRQAKKIRRATVKVLIQRIRQAMASTFYQAHMRFNSWDVLRSCPVEGTNRVLYRLQADIRWHHEPR